MDFQTSPAPQRRWSIRLLLVPAVVLPLLIGGCRTTRNVALPDLPSAFPHHNVEQIETYVNSASDTLTGFAARASVSVSSPERNARFSSVIDHRRGDSLLLNVKVTLGIEAMRALITPDSFFVYNRLNKKLYYGDIARAGEFLPLPVDGDNLFGLLLGLPQADPDGRWTLTADSSYYQLASRDETLRLTIDPRIWRVVHLQQFDDVGVLIEDRKYSDFAEFDGVLLPRRLVVSRPADTTMASMFYSSIDLNPPHHKLSLDYSDRIERVLIR